MMRRGPGFTAIAVSCLSVAIGANAAIFSLLDPVLLRTLPVRDPDRLVEFVSVYPGEGKHPIGVTRSRYELFRDRNHAFSDLIGFAPARFLVSGEGIEQEQADGLYDSSSAARESNRSRPMACTRRGTSSRRSGCGPSSDASSRPRTIGLMRTALSRS